MKFKIKIITGFRKDQSYTIDADEAHKAYHLFFNTDTRTVFKNGVALIGSEIKGIEPDYHETMGWNPTHNLDSDDWNQIHNQGISRKMQWILATAQEIAKISDAQDFNTSLFELVEKKYPQLEAPTSQKRSGKMKQIGEAVNK